MRNVRILAVLGLMATAGAAHAEVSATVTAMSDYDFRGISQSAEDPALQASVDYANESGWYIGGWASNVDFGPGDPADIELNFYTGFSGGDDALGWDAGIIYYAYPDESDYNYPEIYGNISSGMFSAGLSYSNDWVNSGESSWYLNAGMSVPFAERFTFDLGVGYSFGDAFENIDVSEDGDGSDRRDTEYMDYFVGVGYATGNFELGLRYVDTDLDRGDPLFSSADVLNTEGRVIFTVSTTFPWGE